MNKTKNYPASFRDTHEIPELFFLQNEFVIIIIILEKGLHGIWWYHVRIFV